MNRSWVCAVLVLLVGGAALGVWLVRGGPGDAFSPECPIDAAQQPVLEALPGAAADVLDAAEVTRTEAPAPAGARAAGTLEILVVDGETLEPLPAAELIVAANGKFDRPDWARTTADREEALRAVGVRLTAGADGRARIPLPEETTWVGARAGSRFGIERIAPGRHATVRIELREDATLTVQVVDVHGTLRPEIAFELVSVGPPNRYEPPHVLFVGAAPPGEVLVTIPHIRDRIDPRVARGGTSFLLKSCVILDRGDVVALDPEALPAGPVRLVVPETGAIRVRVVTPTGDRYPGTAYVHPDGAESVTAVEGEALFPFVAVTGRFLAFVYFLPELGLGSIRVEHEGPRVPGAEVVLTARMESVEASSRVLRGRLLDPAGRVLEDTRCVVAEPPVGNTLARSSYARENVVVTDERGRFELVVPKHVSRPVLSLYREDPDPHRSFDPAWRADIEVPPAGNPGGYELGDVTMREIPLLVSGRVRCDRGVPVAGAGVQVRVQRADEPNPLAAVDPTAPALGRLYAYDAVTRADGSFAIHVEVPDAGGDVTAAMIGYRSPDPVPFVTGQANLEIVLARNLTVAGSLLLDAGVPVEQIQVALVGEHDRGRRPDPAGEFRLTNVPAGTYRFEVGVQGERTPVHVVARVVVGPAGTLPDPRLQGIDLRGRFNVVELETVDDSGAAVADAPIGIFGSKRPGFSTGAYGRVTIVTGAPGLDLLVAKVGYRAQVLEDIRGSRRVVMSPALAVRVLVRGDLSELPAGWRPGAALSMALRSGDPLNEFTHLLAPRPAFLAAGELCWRVALPGRYVVGFGAEMSTERGLRVFRVASDLATPIDVRDRAGAQLFEVDVPEAAVRAFVAEFHR